MNASIRAPTRFARGAPASKDVPSGLVADAEEASADEDGAAEEVEVVVDDDVDDEGAVGSEGSEGKSEELEEGTEGFGGEEWVTDEEEEDIIDERA